MAKVTGTLTKKDIHNLQELKLWLEDNIDIDSDIHFDNEGEVTSKQALASLNKLEGLN